MDTRAREVTQERWVEQAANNGLLLLVSRVTMALFPVVATLVVSVGWLYLQGLFGQQAFRMDALDRQLSAMAAETTDQGKRIAAVESAAGLTAQSVNNNAQSFQGWQVSVNGRLDKLTDSISALSSQVSALSATIRAQAQAPARGINIP